MSAFVRLVRDTNLAKADPTRQPLEEAIALRQLTQSGCSPRRQEAEIASILRDLGADAPVDQGVERLDPKPPQPRLVLAMRLGGVDDVVSVQPVSNKGVNQFRWVLAIPVHEQDGAEPGVLQSRQQRGFLA